MNWLNRCLESVKESTVKADLFIVDNGSTDGSIDFIRENYPDAKFIISSENLGFGKANNIGLEFAIENRYKYIYLLNQDAWVEQDTFECLIKVAEANPEYGVVSPLQINASMSLVDFNFYHCCSRELISDALISASLKTIYEAHFVMAAHWLITAECLRLVGNFSSTFPHYGEDNNYIDRLKFHGMKAGIAPHCRGIHDREQRLISNEKKEYLFYITNLIKLSDPNQKPNILKIICSYIVMSLNQKRIGYIKYISRTIKNYRNVKLNRLKSMKIGTQF